MNTLSQPVQPFRPAALSPRAATVLNALLPLAGEDGILLWPESPVALRLLPAPQAVAPSIRARLRWFGGTWTVDIGDVDVARIHPFLKELPPDAEIPEALRLAALDMLALSALETLGTVGGNPQSLEHGFAEPELLAEPEAAAALPAPCLWLEAILPGGEAFPVRVHLPKEDAPVLALLEALSAGDSVQKSAATVLSASRIPLSELAVALTVEAGSMRLSLAQCRDLSVGDILLPETYPAHENRVRLVVDARRPMPVLHCSLCGRTATIEHLTLPPEASMTDTSDSLASDILETTDAPMDEQTENAPLAAEDSISVPDIDLAVSFELERRLMTVAEVAALRPGHTFTLMADPLSPVTVRVQGKAVGSGRLVDLGGTLGVQITTLS